MIAGMSVSLKIFWPALVFTKSTSSSSVCRLSSFPRLSAFGSSKSKMMLHSCSFCSKSARPARRVAQLRQVLQRREPRRRVLGARRRARAPRPARRRRACERREGARGRRRARRRAHRDWRQVDGESAPARARARSARAPVPRIRRRRARRGARGSRIRPRARGSARARLRNRSVRRLSAARGHARARERRDRHAPGLRRCRGRGRRRGAHCAATRPRRRPWRRPAVGLSPFLSFCLKRCFILRYASGRRGPRARPKVGSPEISPCAHARAAGARDGRSRYPSSRLVSARFVAKGLPDSGGRPAQPQDTGSLKLTQTDHMSEATSAGPFDAVLVTERLWICEFRESDRAAVREYTSDEATMAAYPPRGRSMTLAPPTGGSAWSAARPTRSSTKRSRRSGWARAAASSTSRSCSRAMAPTAPPAAPAGGAAGDDDAPVIGHVSLHSTGDRHDGVARLGFIVARGRGARLRDRGGARARARVRAARRRAAHHAHLAREPRAGARRREGRPLRDRLRELLVRGRRSAAAHGPAGPAAAARPGRARAAAAAAAAADGYRPHVEHQLFTYAMLRHEFHEADAARRWWRRRRRARR